ncbi:MAG: hypothetical protein ACJA2W_000796 [Planctomycetota bacterium]
MVALGLPLRSGDEATHDGADSCEYEQPLLNTDDAREDSFFPTLKAASVKSPVPFGARVGQPLKLLRDPNLAKAFADTK